MKIQKILLFIFAFIFSCVWNSAFASINFTLTPLKYEINADPWETITRVAQIRNNWDETVILQTGASDFQSNGTTWVPDFVRRSELVFPDQALSSWITIDRPDVTIAPGETQGFSFDIEIPVNATPGGHYAAVFFKNPNSESSDWVQIWINVDYGILLLVNVAWEIVVDVDIDDVVIDSSRSRRWNGSSWSGISNIWIDDCPFWDFTNSNFDGKCIDNFFKNSEDDFQNIANEWNTPEDEGLPNWTDTDRNNGNESIDTLENFAVSFTLPINNNGNTHVKPTGKIKLIDENGETIQAVWKEIQRNDFGAVIGEKIVDYIPLNDEGWNILPKTKRIFESTWEWFPYKTVDKTWNQIIEYWKPWEYYTNQNIAENKFQMPWERVSEKRETKTVQAIIELAYEDENGETIEYNSAEEFEIEYTEQYTWLNPYVILPFFFFIGFFLLWWIIATKRKVPCINENCKQKLKRNKKRCPKCDTLQKEENKKATKKSIVPITKKKKGNKVKDKNKKKKKSKKKK